MKKTKYEFKGKCDHCRKLIKTNDAKFSSGIGSDILLGFYTNCPFCGWETTISSVEGKRTYQWWENQSMVLTKKEYNVAVVNIKNGEQLKKILNDYGANGWTLVQVVPNVNLSNQCFAYAVFIRDTGKDLGYDGEWPNSVTYGPIPKPDFVGLTEEAAKLKSIDDDYMIFHVSSRDGVQFPMSASLCYGRVAVDIINDRVVKASQG